MVKSNRANLMLLSLSALLQADKVLVFLYSHDKFDVTHFDMTIVLNDTSIREELKTFLNSSSIRPRKIIDELHVHRGNAIADVVALYKEAHCFEIKGETDNLSRIRKQSQFFDLAFKKVTLVTTENHLKQAMIVAPIHWGILLTYQKGSVVKLKYIRKTGRNPHFRKDVAALTLWKHEMLELSASSGLESSPRANKSSLSSALASHLPEKALNEGIANLLVNRTKNSHSS